MSDKDFHCVSVLFLEDDYSSIELIHSGNMESCQSVMRHIPAISYNGSKKIKSAEVHIIDDAKWQRLKTLQAA